MIDALPNYLLQVYKRAGTPCVSLHIAGCLCRRQVYVDMVERVIQHQGTHGLYEAVDDVMMRLLIKDVTRRLYAVELPGIDEQGNHVQTWQWISFACCPQLPRYRTSFGTYDFGEVGVMVPCPRGVWNGRWCQQAPRPAQPQTAQRRRLFETTAGFLRRLL